MYYPDAAMVEVHDNNTGMERGWYWLPGATWGSPGGLMAVGPFTEELSAIQDAIDWEQACHARC